MRAHLSESDEMRARAERVLSDYEDARRLVAPYPPLAYDMTRVQLARDVLALTDLLRERRET